MKGKTRKESKIIYRIRYITLLILGLLISIFGVIVFEYAMYCGTLTYIRANYVLTEEEENSIIPFNRYILEKFGVIENEK